MLEQRQIRIQDLEISEKDIYLAMGYRGNVPDSYVCELIAETYSEIVPYASPGICTGYRKPDRYPGRKWKSRVPSLPQEHYRFLSARNDTSMLVLFATAGKRV